MPPAVRPILTLILLLPIVLLGCGGGSSSVRTPLDPNAPRTWTVLVYMAADNNLEEYGIEDINEMESARTTDQAAILVQIDRKEGGDESNGGWTTTRRYRITHDSDTSTIGSELLVDLGELNMADPATLSDFVRWGVENYPAQHYLLVLWDHGQGWQTGAMMERPGVRAIHVDLGNGYDEMSLPELEQALGAGPHMDIVLFDACLMGMLEVAYAIRDSADIMVASEEDIPLMGQPYQSLAGRLTSNPSATPRDLAPGLVNDYVNYYAGRTACTLSALDLTGLNTLVSATDGLAATMSADLGSWRDSIRTAADQTQHFSTSGTYTDYRDLYDFAKRLRASIASPQIQSAAGQVMTAIDGLVIAQRYAGGSLSGSHGVSIYLPMPTTRSGPLTTQYSGISFGRDTRWNEFFSAY